MFLPKILTSTKIRFVGYVSSFSTSRKQNKKMKIAFRQILKTSSISKIREKMKKGWDKRIDKAKSARWKRIIRPYKFYLAFAIFDYRHQLRCRAPERIFYNFGPDAVRGKRCQFLENDGIPSNIFQQVIFCLKIDPSVNSTSRHDEKLIKTCLSELWSASKNIYPPFVSRRIKSRISTLWSWSETN